MARFTAILASAFLAAGTTCAAAAELNFDTAAQALLKQYCFDCHSNESAEANVNLEQMTARRAFGPAFKSWEKVAAMLEAGKMPPKDADQPSQEQRHKLIRMVRNEVRLSAEVNAGDPGPVVLRRLTSAEYAYAVQDLTGLDLDLDREFVSDAAGGEGFTNVGTVQFLDDSGLERYLEAAKKVAKHAVIGAGPLEFFIDPGKTGFELSAIHRVRQIYREHGIRTSAGEGAVPFGLDRYPKAFFAAWRYRHQPGTKIETLAAQEGLQPQFVRHVWSALTNESLSFPASEIAAKWLALPGPEKPEQEIREACEELYRFMSDWQVRLAKAVGDEEEAPVLSESSFQVERQHRFFARFAWMEPPTRTRVQFSVVSGDPSRIADSVVVWKNPRMRFRRLTRRREEAPPLMSLLKEESAAPFAFGKHPRGAEIGPQDFVTIGNHSPVFEIDVPEGARGMDVMAEVELDLAHGEDCVVRCSIIEGTEPKKLNTVSALLANPDGAPFKAWRAGVIDFARLLPQVSHREPSPSDRDPIPFPFDNTYNMPERNFFHTGVKYHRDDAFFTEMMIDAGARRRLEEAWTDLLGSFEYYDILLRFVAEKYKVDLAGSGIQDLDDAAIQRFPDDTKEYVSRLREDFRNGRDRLKHSQSRHSADVMEFASRAWRRPLTQQETLRLLDFYSRLRDGSKLTHDEAVRALIARVLVAPEFVYRAERPTTDRGFVELSDWELASRLSFLVWSSLPDEELRRAAAAGELRNPEGLARQARRMVRDPKARRFATEFFGQWFGFYQFDRYRGVDPERFPEFSEKLRADLYGEAIAFFEHIVRENRPVKEILFADYAFLNDELAKHYAIERTDLSAVPARVDGLATAHRGGLLGLGAVLTLTSAPLRTSPVKRGDWILRRVLNTPVPPPPANAGSIAADDTPADGKTVRQRLEAHRQDVTCVNCHSRIDPLGFSLEHYDSLGRWRETYRNDEPIDDTLIVADGPQVSGPTGLRTYLAEHQAKFHRALCGKLLAYALGRGELVTDKQLVEKMLADVRSGEGNVSDLIVDIVNSKQFRQRRGE